MSAEPTFEQLQAELEQIVERLERGDVGLDELTKLWERGEELYRRLSEQLAGAQGRDRGACASARRRDAGSVRMSAMDTDDTDLIEEEAAAESATTTSRRTTSASCWASSTDDQRAQIQEQLDAVGARLDEVTATLAERSGRDSWKTNSVHVELFESGQTMIKASVEDTEEDIEFNVELRPSNFFDEARPWRPGEPPRHMGTGQWDVEGEVLVMRVAKVSGRKYTIQETAAELEESRHDSPDAAVAASRSTSTTSSSSRSHATRRPSSGSRTSTSTALLPTTSRPTSSSSRIARAPRRARRGRRARGPGRR